MLSSIMEAANGTAERRQRPDAILDHCGEDLVKYAGMEALGSSYRNIYSHVYIVHFVSLILGYIAFPERL
jgi:hypothetical protein